MTMTQMNTIVLSTGWLDDRHQSFEWLMTEDWWLGLEPVSCWSTVTTLRYWSNWTAGVLVPFPTILDCRYCLSSIPFLIIYWALNSSACSIYISSNLLFSLAAPPMFEMWNLSIFLICLCLSSVSVFGQTPSFPDCQNGPLAKTPVCNGTLPIPVRAAYITSLLTVAEKVSRLQNGSPAIDRIGLPGRKKQWRNQRMKQLCTFIHWERLWLQFLSLIDSFSTALVCLCLCRFHVRLCLSMVEWGVTWRCW